MQTTYHYKTASSLTKTSDKTELFLSNFNESYEDNNAPCFFWGKLTEPYTTARCLLTLSKIVSANYMPNNTSLRDPVITAGGGKLRMEAFSSCCSVYGKVDILPEAIDGEFLQLGTTNVDFNTEMIASLSKIKKHEQVFFSVGKKEVVMQSQDNKVSEKKVSLPLRWVKGMTTVQILSAEMKKKATLDKLQMQLLFKAIPKGDVKDDYYLSFRGKRPVLSPIASAGSICIGAIQRLRLVETILPLARSLTVFAPETESASAFQFHFTGMRFTIMLSRSHWRGFSGEGSALANLAGEIPDSWIEKLDTYAKVHEEFNENSPLLKELSSQDFKNVATRLSAMGLLVYDLHDRFYYYRKLPFKLNKIESLNPRYKNALEIISKKAYQLIDTSPDHIEIHVNGSGVMHKVLLTPKKSQCTCTWHATHQNDRGECKHILAARILKNNTNSEIEQILEDLKI